MLKDLGREAWLEWLAIPPERVPEVLVLRGTRNLRSQYARHARLFEDVWEVGSPNGLFEDVLIGRYGGVGVGYASVYGPAMASEITHLFGVLGTRLVIQTGCCGAIGPGIGAGDVVCATAGHCGDGASQCYLPGRDVVEATPALVEQIRSLAPAGVTLHQGALWTTAALLAEGRGELETWARQGCVAADMETATTFAVAEHFGMERASLLYVFDNPLAEEHLLAADAGLQERRRAAEAAMVDVTLALIQARGCR